MDALEKLEKVFWKLSFAADPFETGVQEV